MGEPNYPLAGLPELRSAVHDAGNNRQITIYGCANGFVTPFCGVFASNVGMLDDDAKKVLQGKTGLVDSHSVTGDSEQTRMRSGRDLRDLAVFLGGQASCDDRAKIMASVFRFRGRTDHFPGLP